MAPDMTLVERLKSALGVSGTSTISYSLTVYRCESCGATFDASGSVDEVTCPDCSADEQVRKLTVPRP